MLQSLPGFRDFYPDEMAVRNYVFAKWREVARRYGFREYDGPPLESLELYTVKSGAEIVGQLYNFKDKGDRDVALRPEMTPTLARMVAAQERQFKKPLKWFAIPQLFRYERQQKGRLREHFQLNCDIIGEDNFLAETELVMCLIDSLRALGLTEKDFVVKVSDRYFWQGFLDTLGIVDERQGGVFAVLDKMGRTPLDVSKAALSRLALSDEQIEKIFRIAAVNSDWAEFATTEELKERVWRFVELKKSFEAFGALKFLQQDFSIVRGLAYYTGIVFEVHACEGKHRAIAGGGRYDNLLKLVSGGKVDLPSLGFGMGDVVLTDLLQEKGKLSDASDFVTRSSGPKFHIDAYVVFMGGIHDLMKTGAFKLIHDLRDAGYSIDYPLSSAGVGKQLETAAALNARWAIVLGPEEWQSGQVDLRNMASKTREKVAVSEIAARIAK